MLQKLISTIFVNLKHRGLSSKVNELIDTEFLPSDAIIDYQNKKLRNLIIHAYQQVPYYKSLFESFHITPSDIQTIDDLYKIPILDKETIQKNHSFMISLDHKRFYKRTTTGSTGVPLCIISDNNNKLIEIALMHRFLKNIGKEFGSKEINLWGRPDGSFSAVFRRAMKKIFYNINYINIYDLKEHDLYDIINLVTRNPNIHLRGFTSIIYLLACKLQEMQKQLNIDAISVTAEKLFLSQREVIEHNLTKNLYDQYGCNEINSIAFECNMHNGLHHAFEHSILEIIDFDGRQYPESGEVIITNLDNYTMPLIRYRNGDIATLAKQKCSCGRNSQLIKNIDGRLYDFIEGINGQKVHSAFLDHILVDSNILFKHNVKEIRIIQTELDQIVIQYVSNEIIPENELDSIKKEIYKHLGPMKISITKKDRISDTKNGKRKFVIPYSDFLLDKSIV